MQKHNAARTVFLDAAPNGLRRQPNSKTTSVVQKLAIIIIACISIDFEIRGQ